MGADADSGGPWLSHEERAAWIALMGVVVRLESALDTQLKRESGITHFEYATLAALSETPQRTLRMSELAGLAGGSLSRLSQVVSRLEVAGWVRREPDPMDGRYTLAVLTEDGYAKVVSSALAHVSEVRRLVFDPLTTAQVRQLAAIGSRIGATLAPSTPTGRS